MNERKQKLHIGLIMDGNGRWATTQDKPRLFGHTQGVQTVIEVVRKCPSIGVHTVTLFAFAIANWKRDKEEVDGLWVLFHDFIQNGMKEMLEEGTRVVFIGNRGGLPEHIVTAAEKLEEDSKENTVMLLQIALNYDGVDEVVRMIQQALKDDVQVDDIDSSYVHNHLDTQLNNDPDIIIRTGLPVGEKGMAMWRSSGFLPIQSVQSVCVSTEVLWPDFTLKHLKEIIAYANPDARLYGGQR